MSITIERGDTLSALALRYGTSVTALARENGISNPNLILAGAQLKVGGGGGMFSADSFSPAGGSSGFPNLSGDLGSAAAGTGSAAYNLARSLLGNNIADLKNSGPLASLLDPSAPNNVCCANFVSACLEKAGLIGAGQRSDGVAGLADNLRNDPNFRSVSLANAKPGDVVCFNVPGEGPYSHVEMFAGFQNGQPTFIGSNNVNADGSQAISQGGAGYPIADIFQHV